MVEYAFSRLPCSSEEENSVLKTGVTDTFAIEVDDVEMSDCFLAYPIFNDEDPHEYPLDYQTISIINKMMNDFENQRMNACQTNSHAFK